MNCLLSATRPTSLLGLHPGVLGFPLSVPLVLPQHPTKFGRPCPSKKPLLLIVLPIPADSWRQSQAPTQDHLDLCFSSHLSSNVHHQFSKTAASQTRLHTDSVTLSHLHFVNSAVVLWTLTNTKPYSSPTLGVTIVAATGKEIRARQLVIVLLLLPAKWLPGSHPVVGHRLLHGRGTKCIFLHVFRFFALC